ncbi:MAG: hypothetical protein AAGI92_10585 [Pseudomonadota bacterium]
MSEDKPPEEYEQQTLFIAAGIFFGFCLLLYYLPAIMNQLGGENPWITGGAIGVVLMVPFIGLWLRGRAQRKKKTG